MKQKGIFFREFQPHPRWSSRKHISSPKWLRNFCVTSQCRVKFDGWLTGFKLWSRLCEVSMCFSGLPRLQSGWLPSSSSLPYRTKSEKMLCGISFFLAVLPFNSRNLTYLWNPLINHIQPFCMHLGIHVINSSCWLEEWGPFAVFLPWAPESSALIRSYCINLPNLFKVMPNISEDSNLTFIFEKPKMNKSQFFPPFNLTAGAFNLRCSVWKHQGFLGGGCSGGCHNSSWCHGLHPGVVLGASFDERVPLGCNQAIWRVGWVGWDLCLWWFKNWYAFSLIVYNSRWVDILLTCLPVAF